MRILPTLGVSAAIVLVGCAKTNPTAATSQNAGPSNADVEQSIKSKLASDPKMADTKIDVSADTGKNQVTLSGTVYSEAARTEAVNFAKDARPGVEVSTKSM